MFNISQPFVFLKPVQERLYQAHPPPFIVGEVGEEKVSPMNSLIVGFVRTML